MMKKTGVGILMLVGLCAQAEISPELDAILERYCYSCHDDDVQKGDVDLFAPHPTRGLQAASF